MNNRTIDLHDCIDPMSRQYFRHPVMGSDGKLYELEPLLKWLKAGHTEMSPFNDSPLIHASYDSAMQKTIVELISTHKINEDEVYEGYTEINVTDQLMQLQEYLPQSPTLQMSLIRSAWLASAGILFCAISLVIEDVTGRDLQSTNTIGLIIIGIAAVDFAARILTKHQLGFFSGSLQGIKHMIENSPTTKNILELEPRARP